MRQLVARSSRVSLVNITRRRSLLIGSGAALAAVTARVGRGATRGKAAPRSADYVIVGAGSAGCVLARRLSEAGASVILLEAGGADSLPQIQEPRDWPGLQGSAVDWQYKTVPQPQTLDRVHAWARGKVLGGSGSINAMAHHRGHPSCYDSWQAQFGVRGWSFRELLPYFKRLESFALGASDYHGGDGPIYVDVPRGELQHPAAQAFIASGVAAGWQPTDDINGPSMEGPTWNHVALRGRQRQSPALCYLRPAVAGRHPPAVLTGVRATRLRFDGKRCVGVDYVNEAHATAGGAGRRESTLRAHREVLLCTGSIESPKLLMLSGLGAPQELERHGIAVRVALPGVGQNLQDHLLGAGNVYEASRPLPLSNYQHGEGMHYLRTDAKLPGPDLLLMFVTVPFASFTLPPPPANAYTILPCIMQPQSRGTIGLQSADPLAAPRIDPRYFTASEDLATMTRGFEVARAIGSQAPLAAWRLREAYPAARWNEPRSRDEFVRNAVNTFFHPVGTCAMGIGPQAVVDEALRVHGVEGLRVIDASVIPRIPSAATHAPVIAIAERAADLLLGRAPAA